MNKRSNILKAGIGYTIGNYLLKGLTFLTIPIFTRVMSTSDYGKYNTYVSYEALIFIIIGFSFHASLKNAKYKYGDKFNNYVSDIIVIQFISLFIWVFIVNLLYSFWGNLIGYSRDLVNLLLLFSFATAVIQVYNSYLSLEYRYDSFLKLSGVNSVINIFLSLFLILRCYSKDAYIGRIMGTVIPSCLIAVYVICEMWKKQKPTFNRQYVEFAFNYSLPIIPHGLSQVILSQFDRIMISVMVGNTQAGLYSFAYNIYSIVFITTSSTDQVWGTWFYEKMNAGEEREIKAKAHIYAMGMACFVSFIILIAPEIVFVLGTKEYQEAIYTVVPIVASGYFSFLYTLPVQVEYYFSRTKLIALGSFGAALVNIVLNYVFIKNYGYVAAAYITLITYIVYFVFHLFISWRILRYQLYSIKSLVCCSFFVLFSSAISVIALEYPLVRFAVILIWGVIMGSILRKELH